MGSRQRTSGTAGRLLCELNHRNNQLTTLSAKTAQKHKYTKTQSEERTCSPQIEDEGSCSKRRPGEPSWSDLPPNPGLRDPPSPASNGGEKEREGAFEGEEREPELRAPQTARALCLAGEEDEQGGHPQALDQVHPKAPRHGGGQLRVR